MILTVKRVKRGESSKMMKSNDLQMGTLGGALCSVWATVSWGDLFQTVLMAAIGTLVSYAISAVLSRSAKK